MKVISGEIQAQELNDNFSEVDAHLAQTMSGAYNVKKNGLIGDGGTDDYIAFNSLLTEIGNNDSTIIFPKGIYKFSTSVTIPDNITLLILDGAMLSPDISTTITINGDIDANWYQIFKGEGSIRINGVGEIKSSWFLTNNDASLDITTELQNMIDAPQNANHVIPIHMSPGKYLFSSTLNLKNNTVIYRQGYKKSYPYDVQFQFNVNDGSNAFESLEANNGAFRGCLEGIEIVAIVGYEADTSNWNLGSGIHVDYAAYTEFVKNVSIKYFTWSIVSTKNYVSTLTKPMAQYCRNGIKIGIANACYIMQPDLSKIGEATTSTIGNCILLESGGGLHVSGGNLGNGGYNTIFRVLAGSLFSYGIYSEANKYYFASIDEGSVYVIGGYIKDAKYFCRFNSDNGKLVMRDIVSRNLEFSNVPFIDSSPSSSAKFMIENWSVDGIEKENIKYSEGIFQREKEWDKPLTQNGSMINIPNNVVTDILSISIPTGTQSYSFFIKYRIGAKFYTNEMGELYIHINRYSGVSAVVTIQKNNELNTTRSGTLVITFDSEIVGTSSETQEIILNVNSNNSDGLDANIDYNIEQVQSKKQLKML